MQALKRCEPINALLQLSAMMAARMLQDDRQEDA